MLEETIALNEKIDDISGNYIIFNYTQISGKIINHISKILWAQLLPIILENQVSSLGFFM